MVRAVRWGFIDSLIAQLSPRVAKRRYADRIAIDTMRRSYDGAGKGRGTDGWSSGVKSADAEIGAAGALLRDRMRDLVRNDALAAQAVQVLVNNIVGPGIRPRAKSSNKALNRKVDKLWEQFARDCDFHGHTDFHGLTALAVRGMIEGGETLALQQMLPVLQPGRVPLKIELREGDHLDSSRVSYSPAGERTDQGIEYDARGRRVAYWMFPDHPGGNTTTFGRRFTSERVAAGLVAHLFERQRMQNRGVPWGTPAMRALRDFGDWHRAELVRKKTEACMVAFVVSEDAGTPPLTGADHGSGAAPGAIDSNGTMIETFEPGMIGYLNNARDVKFNQPANVGGVEEWSRTQMHIIAAGFRVPYALMSGDLKGANFSSSRVGLNEFRRMVEQLQWQTVIPMFCQPIWDWFVLAARTAGLLPMGDGPIPVEWAPPRFESVNPKQDAEADLIEVRAGFASLSQKIAARGYDPEAVLEEWAAIAAVADRLNLVFDSDPRRVTKGGNAAQASEPPKSKNDEDEMSEEDDDDAEPGGAKE